MAQDLRHALAPLLLALACLAGLAGCAAGRPAPAPALAAPSPAPKALVIGYGMTQCPLLYSLRADNSVEFSGPDICRDALRDAIIRERNAPPDLNRGKEL